MLKLSSNTQWDTDRCPKPDAGHHFNNAGHSTEAFQKTRVFGKKRLQLKGISNYYLKKNGIPILKIYDEFTIKLIIQLVL